MTFALLENVMDLAESQQLIRRKELSLVPKNVLTLKGRVIVFRCRAANQPPTPAIANLRKRRRLTAPLLLQKIIFKPLLAVLIKKLLAIPLSKLVKPAFLNSTKAKGPVTPAKPLAVKPAKSVAKASKVAKEAKNKLRNPAVKN